MKPKIIAFYLPQYHAIPENDEWWGKGFTEWTNVKKSTPLFRHHNQPEIPLNNNYYNLLDETTQMYQSNLAQKYGIYGFCYYHYWFNGKLLLEKPMERMLANKEITIPFCICWANESWARTWDGDDKDYLIKQNYSCDINDWKNHFDYFVQFFKDDRYIKNDGKPMLIIYKPYLFEHFSEMIDYWRQRAIESGLTGLYVGYQNHLSFEHDVSFFDFGIYFEPYYTYWEMSKIFKFFYYLKHPLKLIKKIKNKLIDSYTIVNYDMIWDRILRRQSNGSVYYGAFTSWDNTPRKRDKATIFWHSTPKKFKRYFSLLLAKAQNESCNYIFINAWNEWGEGAHLEPDELNSFEYLNAIEIANIGIDENEQYCFENTQKN